MAAWADVAACNDPVSGGQPVKMAFTRFSLETVEETNSGYVALADLDGDGDADLVLRGLGLGGRYVIGTRQTRVTLFLQQND